MTQSVPLELLASTGLSLSTLLLGCVVGSWATHLRDYSQTLPRRQRPSKPELHAETGVKVGPPSCTRSTTLVEVDAVKSALEGCLSSIPRRLSPRETAALLTAMAGGANECLPLQQCILSLVYTTTGRLASSPECSFDFASGGGVQLAVRALLDYGSHPTSHERARVVAHSAGALANLAAAAGANKEFVLNAGGVHSLLLCIGRLARDGAEVMDSLDRSTSGGVIVELCVQCTRAVGNLCYGSGKTTEAIKEVILNAGEYGGVNIFVELVRKWCKAGYAGADRVCRWTSHAIHNMVVGNNRMQQAIGERGGGEVLCESLSRCQFVTSATTLGCKAIAYIAKDHEDNRHRIDTAGGIQLAISVLRKAVAEATRPDSEPPSSWTGTAESACAMVAFVVAGSASRATSAVRRGALIVLMKFHSCTLIYDEIVEQKILYSLVRWWLLAVGAIARAVVAHGMAEQQAKFRCACQEANINVSTVERWSSCRKKTVRQAAKQLVNTLRLL